METIKLTATVMLDPKTNKITGWSDRKVVLGNNVIYKDPEVVLESKPFILPVQTPSVVQTPAVPAENQRGDCENPELYLENRKDGNCLFEAVAQIYEPIDNRNGDPTTNGFDEKVVPIARHFRELVAKAYEKALIEPNFIPNYKFPSSSITVDSKPYTLSEYAEYIKKNYSWASNDDLEILTRLLGIHPVNVILHNTDPSFNSTGNAYTFCNINNKHWVLKKGGPERTINNDNGNALRLLNPNPIVGNKHETYVTELTKPSSLVTPAVSTQAPYEQIRMPVSSFDSVTDASLAKKLSNISDIYNSKNFDSKYCDGTDYFMMHREECKKAQETQENCHNEEKIRKGMTEFIDEVMNSRKENGIDEYAILSDLKNNYYVMIMNAIESMVKEINRAIEGDEKEWSSECVSKCASVLIEALKKEFDSTYYMVYTLYESVISVDDNVDVKKYIKFTSADGLTGKWSEDSSKITITDTTTDSTEPISPPSTSRLIMAFGPSASGKTHCAEQMISILSKADEHFPKSFMSIDGGICRETSLIYQLIVKIVQKTCAGNTGKKHIGLSNLVLTSQSRWSTAKNVVKTSIFKDAGNIKKKIFEYLRKQTPKLNLYVPETLGGCGSMTNCENSYSEYIKYTGDLQWIGLNIWQHQSRTNPIPTDPKKYPPQHYCDTDTNYGVYQKCVGCKKSGESREKKEGKKYSGLAWEYSKENGDTEAKKAPGGRYLIHNSGGQTHEPIPFEKKSLFYNAFLTQLKPGNWTVIVENAAWGVYYNKNGNIFKIEKGDKFKSKLDANEDLDFGEIIDIEGVTLPNIGAVSNTNGMKLKIKLDDKDQYVKLDSVTSTVFFDNYQQLCKTTIEDWTPKSYPPNPASLNYKIQSVINDNYKKEIVYVEKGSPVTPPPAPTFSPVPSVSTSPSVSAGPVSIRTGHVAIVYTARKITNNFNLKNFRVYDYEKFEYIKKNMDCYLFESETRCINAEKKDEFKEYLDKPDNYTLIENYKNNYNFKIPGSIVGSTNLGTLNCETIYENNTGTLSTDNSINMDFSKRKDYKFFTPVQKFIIEPTKKPKGGTRKSRSIPRRGKQTRRILFSTA